MPSSAEKKEFLWVPGNLSVIFSSCESSKKQHATQLTLIKPEFHKLKYCNSYID